MQKPIVTRSSCKAMKDFHSNLKFTSVARGHLRISYQEFSNFNSYKAQFIRRISAVSNTIQTKDNEANHLIIYCLNCIRHGRNATYEPGLSSAIYRKCRVRDF